MRLGIIGGAGVRSPLLIKNLMSRKDSGLSEIAIFDTDFERLELMSSIMNSISEKLNGTINIKLCSDFETMADGTDFIFSSFREGGDKGRILDEEIPERFQMLGQETVGAGGAAMALRTLPAAIDYAKKLKAISPEAWLINFTNPSGIISQALLKYSGNKKIIGICDAPVVIQNMAARYLKCNVNEISFKSFGLNHLGWVYDIRRKGNSVLEQLVNEAEAFVQVEPLYIKLLDHIKETGMIPNEYLLFYLHPDEIRKNYADKSYSRSRFIAGLNMDFYEKLKNGKDTAIKLYQEYLSEREGSYMSVETGKKREKDSSDFFTKKNNFGYDDVAIAVMNALRGAEDITLPVNRLNDGCQYLEKEDVVEVTSQVTGGGFTEGFEVPEFPESCVNLIKSVKTYERKLVDGFMKKDKSLIIAGLKSNPLIHDEKAELLFNSIVQTHKIDGFYQ